MRYVILALTALMILPACDDEAATGKQVVNFGRDMAPNQPVPDMGVVMRPDMMPPVPVRVMLLKSTSARTCAAPSQNPMASAIAERRK